MIDMNDGTPAAGVDNADYTVRVRSRGGAGRNATWQWEVYAPGGVLPLKKGTAQGTEAKAHELGRREAERLKTTALRRS
jgi:hypothetical protein